MAFSLTRTEFAVPTSASSSLKINGTDSRELGATLISFPDIALPPTNERLLIIEGRDGSFDSGQTYGQTWPFTLDFQIVGFSLDDVNDKRRELYRWIDIEQGRGGSHLIGSKRINTVKIELSGYKYWYKTGLVQVTNGNATIWGTGLERTTQVETTTSTTANKLEDTSVNFINLGIAVGDVIVNLTNSPNDATKVSAIDDLDTLTVEDDIFVSGDTYRIYENAKWDYYVRPGVVFNVVGDTTDYYVANLVHESKLELTANISRESASELQYRIERRMYLFANYNGDSSTSTVFQQGGFFKHGSVLASNSQIGSYAQNISIGFRTPIPYLLGDEFVFEETSITESDVTGEFFEVEGVGNSVCRPTIQLYGAATSPEITIGNKAFTCQFNTNVLARDVQNKQDITHTTFTSDVSTDILFRRTRSDYGLLIGASNNEMLYYNDMPGNRFQGSFVMRLRPQWDSVLTDGIDKYFFSWLADTGPGTINTTDYVKFYYDESSDRFVLLLASNTAGEIPSNVIIGNLTFESDNYIEVAGWWNASGVVDTKDNIRYYAKIFANGEIIGTETDPIIQYIPESHLLHLMIGGNNSTTSTSVTTNEIEAIISEAAFFTQSISDEEIRSYWISQEPILNDNNTLTFTKTMAANDIFQYHSDTGVSEFYDASAGTRSSGDSSLTGGNIVMRGDDIREAAMFYLSASSDINQFNVVWRSYNH
tara:strand:+ start:2314 stop:4437 length:2124 start_codon:yes stop_codon:yes gene_type:complete